MEMNEVDLLIKSPTLQFYRFRLLASPLVSVALTVMPFLYAAEPHDVETLSLMGEPLHFDGCQVALEDNAVYFDAFLRQEGRETKILPGDGYTQQYLAEHTVYKTVLSDIRYNVLEYFQGLCGISVFVQEDTKDLSVDFLVAMPMDQALQCLERFDLGWWLDYDIADKDKICVNVVSV